MQRQALLTTLVLANAFKEGDLALGRSPIHCQERASRLAQRTILARASSPIALGMTRTSSSLLSWKGSPTARSGGVGDRLGSAAQARMALFGDRLEYRRMSSGGINCVHHPDLSPMSEYEYCEQVIQHLTAQLNAHPQEARAYVLRGNAYLDQRRFHLAIDDYTRALELRPDDPIAYNNRGIAYRSLGDPVRALADYRQALALDVRYRDAYNNLGLALSDLGDFAAAVQAYTQAIAIDPHDWHAYNNRGLAFWALRRRDEARRDYTKVKGLLGTASGGDPSH